MIRFNDHGPLMPLLICVGEANTRAHGFPVRNISRARRNAATPGLTLQEMHVCLRVLSFKTPSLPID